MDLKSDSHYGTLDEILKLTKQNNEMLHSMRRSQRWGSVMHAIYWLIIIGASVAAYYYSQPYIDKLMALYKQNQSVFSDLKNLGSQVSGSSAQVQSFLNQVKGVK